MKQQYRYVGSVAILKSVDLTQPGTKILYPNAVGEWVEHTNQVLVNNQVVATFITNLEEELVISDRHSEHVLCAGGANVLSAGEITFEFDKDSVEVIAITNQSTGYCPKPESWQSVAVALDKIPLSHPGNFTQAHDFRYCMQCKSINLIKDQVFECVVCGADLDLLWNFDQRH